jgi:hypothetical protein
MEHGERKTESATWWQRRMITVNGIIRLSAQIVRVLKSGCFDGKWYIRQRPNLSTTKWPAVIHYVFRGCVDDPSRDFCSQEYLHMNPDVARAGIPALLHYERYGRKGGRRVSLLQTGFEPVFPAQAVEFTMEFSKKPPVHRRTAIFASYSGDGNIEPYVVHYLRGLSEVCDNIIFVSDNPLFETESKKLDGIVSTMLVARHGEYDFGSYRRGWDWAKAHGLLENVDEVVFCNDSCYGPFHPFGTVFETMAQRSCDFWGLTMFQIKDKVADAMRLHFQSFFLVFRKSVFSSKSFEDFISSIKKLPEPTREYVIERYEFSLTSMLEDSGFSYDSFVPKEFCCKYKVLPTYLPSLTLKRYGMPLLKVKTFGDNPWAESPRKALRMAKRLNRELYADMLPHFNRRLDAFKKQIKNRKLPRIDLDAHQASFGKKIAKIRARIDNGLPVRTTFLVSSASMFPSRPLFEVMLDDPIFEPRIVVVPGDTSQNIEELSRELKILEEELPSAGIIFSWTGDEIIPWRDISTDSDLVIYNSPYANSHFFYNSRFSYGRDFLPVHVNYGYYRSIYDRHVMGMDTFAYFWKAFFENEDTLEEYSQYSVLKGSNGVLTGYCKMDSLSKKRKSPGNRKCVLLAPHHSIEGGLNRILGLSNFEEYASLFLELPRLYPTCMFIFRPHPMLFKVLAREHLWGEERVEDWCRQMRSHPNVRWSDGGDYFQDFADSDAIIQDCGSFLVEYFYTGKPCCFMLKSPKDIENKFTPLGKACLQHCYLAYDKSAIIQFMEQVVVEGNDSLEGERRRFAEERIMINYPEASITAVELIRGELGLGRVGRG